MSPEETLYAGKNAVVLIFYLSMPTIAVAASVGLVVALIQTLIQLQEQTLAFALKLMAVMAVLALTGSWMANHLFVFLDQIFARINDL
ncbi:EscS/YscS/HrcS family type III secretion system export apparatus protein [Phyllobacterium salinisoli]|uniref:EscS/YscS/HrcS family type III secretion system export apparatus protein n=1 Tax=Phyllobacterium salinisoli TaxID=1899321 RepID=A0A368JYN9_9HYPH|nr:type III secretion system export apparatus subunit SctS [Phyllobacterium salinisoli]RCS21565.1 EscS/YscS/HrcS family type III secretion system export apparatus protein [Phyllobacterium salinisoli]